MARRNHAVQKNLMKIGARKLLRVGLVLARVCGRTSLMHCTCRKVEVEATYGGNNRQDSRCFSIYFWR